MNLRAVMLTAAMSLPLACASRQATVTSPTATTAPQVATGGYVNAGTRLVTTLETPIGTDVSRVGNPFFTSLDTPVLDEHGVVLVPAGARIMGRIADLTTTRGSNPAVVSLVIEKITINGVERPLEARVVEANAEPTSRKASSRTILGGAGGGALIGAVLGGGSGALKGAAVGAAAGTLVSLGNSKTGAKLPAGSVVVLETVKPISFASGS